MKKILLVIFASFFVAASAAEWRERMTIRTNEILELVEESGKFPDFLDTLNALYNKGDRAWKRPENANFRDVRDHLLGMSCTFITLCNAYVANLLMDYYGAAVWLLETDGATDVETARKIVGFEGHDGFYCMLSAFHDCRLDVDKWLESMFFLRTVPRYNGDYSRAEFLRELRTYRRHYETAYSAKQEIAHLRRGRDVYRVIATVEDPVRALDDVKRRIKRFSDMFRSRWTPMVGYFLHSADARNRESVLVRHVFEAEKCEVHIPVLKNEKMNRRLSILSWTCENILEAKEYRYDEYIKAVTNQLPAQSETLAPNPRPTSEYKPAFSLNWIKSLFHTTCDYKNVVKYFDIVSTAILLVTIREGSKLFKGIRRAVQMSCSDACGGINVAGEMRTLRSRLSAFKSVFDRLIAAMLHKKRVDFRLNPHKMAFDNRLNALMRLLDFRDRRADEHPLLLAEEICAGVPKAVAGMKLNGEARFGDDRHRYAAVKFYEYYFLSPILNVGRLYRFYECDFL